MKRVRRPAVAGEFYPGEVSALLRMIEGCYRHPLGPGGLPSRPEGPLWGPLGLVLPHAGYIYSGPIAARGFAALAERGRPETVVLLGPNHYGVGPSLAVPEAESWETPLGEVPLDGSLRDRLLSFFPRLKCDDQAHRREHSLEVLLPFLQHLYGTVSILPLVLWDQSRDTCVSLGEALAEALGGKRAVVLASTDLSHYYPREEAVPLDGRVLEAVLSREPTEVERAAEEVNMCGPGAVMAMLSCLRLLGLGKATLLGHATSGDTAGDPSRVVGYCSVLVE